jgi:hypothetical protein
MCTHCKSNASGGTSVHHGERKHLIAEIAESRVASLDAATIMEIAGDERISLDAAIEACERSERKRLRSVPLSKLWEIRENL